MPAKEGVVTGHPRSIAPVRWHLCSREHASTTGHMLYKLAIFASALLAGARAEVRGPPPGGLGARGV